MSLTTEDRLIIHETLARLDFVVDRGDWDTYLAAFTADATMDPGFAPPVAGVAAIRGFLTATEGNTRGKRHVATNVFIEEDGDDDRAVATSYLTVIERESIPAIVATAVITDHLIKGPEGWRITAHTVQIDPGMFKAYAAKQVSQAQT